MRALAKEKIGHTKVQHKENNKIGTVISQVPGTSIPTGTLSYKIKWEDGSEEDINFRNLKELKE